MYCHRCGAEYVDGVTVCDECGVPLHTEPPPRPDLSGDLDLVPVLETGDAVHALFVKSKLEGAGIPYLARNDQLQDLFGFGRLVPVNPISGPVIFLVPAEHQAAARELLAEREQDRDPSD